MSLLNWFNFSRKKTKNPEDDYIVVITDEQIVVTYPDGITEKVFWNDIQQIKLINTDWGPVSPDMWLTLIGISEKCMIPMGAKGFDEIYDVVSKWEGFDFEQFGESMRCTDNKEFVLWTKKT